MIPHSPNMEFSWLHQSKQWVLGLDFPSRQRKGRDGSRVRVSHWINTWGWERALTLTNQEVCTISFESQMWRLPSHWCKWKGFNHIFQLTLRFAWWLWYERSKACRWEAHRDWCLGTEHPQAPAPGFSPAPSCSQCCWDFLSVSMASEFGFFNLFLWLWTNSNFKDT